MDTGDSSGDSNDDYENNLNIQGSVLGHARSLQKTGFL